VGGSARNKDGVGIVIDGHEKLFAEMSPWSIFAEEERRQARRNRIARKKADADVSTPPSYDKWTVRDLQWECKSRGLRVRGKKVVLIQRLTDHDEQPLT